MITIERVTASISVAGTLSLLATFVFIKEFRTLSNTLIFWASFANLFANVAALIGGSALTRQSSPLCQFQGFLLEMFMQSDPMWSLAMAINVYLVFFRRYDSSRLKKLYWIYGVLCYGLPFIPAMVCLLLKVKNKDRIYGNATLWCWIADDWAPLRIYSYYAPVWFCILAALIIYIRVGIEIFQKRSQLQAAGRSSSFSQPEHSKVPHSCPFTGIRTTEISVTHDLWDASGPTSPTTPTSAHMPPEKGEKEPENYTIVISAKSHDASRAKTQVRKTPLWPKRPTSMDKVKWSYFKVSMLFAVSILVTWVPPSINRVHGVRYPEHPSYFLNVGSAIVLPLQGFWNTVIYFTTSLRICKQVMARFRKRKEERDGGRLDRMKVRPAPLRDVEVGDSMEIVSELKKEELF